MELLDTRIAKDTNKYFPYFENCIIYCMRANYPVFETEHSCWNNTFIDIFIDFYTVWMHEFIQNILDKSALYTSWLAPH